jgi:hypothetical protein
VPHSDWLVWAAPSCHHYTRYKTRTTDTGCLKPPPPSPRVSRRRAPRLPRLSSRLCGEHRCAHLPPPRRVSQLVTRRLASTPESAATFHPRRSPAAVPRDHAEISAAAPLPPLPPSVNCATLPHARCSTALTRPQCLPLTQGTPPQTRCLELQRVALRHDRLRASSCQLPRVPSSAGEAPHLAPSLSHAQHRACIPAAGLPSVAQGHVQVRLFSEDSQLLF